MKKLWIFILFVLFLLLFTSAQELVENPEKPQHPKAGRVLKVEKIFRITDESGEFYFKYPYLIKVAYDDSIFIKDTSQLLRFDKNGRFIRNYFVKGQGPGEFNSIKRSVF